MPQPSSVGGLSRRDVVRLVNRYIGVESGYLGDFSYRSHADFYPEYCELDVNPKEFAGTTRERFIEILESRTPRDQAKIIRGALEKYPAGSAPERTPEMAASFAELADRLESGPMVATPTSLQSSDVVRRALEDVQTLLAAGELTSCVDRVHTSLHGHLRHLCEAQSIPYAANDTTVALLKKLRKEHPRLKDPGPRAGDIQTVINGAASILDALNPVRNQASVAHPNALLLGPAEAQLVVNIGRTLLTYIDAKLAGPMHELDADAVRP